MASPADNQGGSAPASSKRAAGMLQRRVGPFPVWAYLAVGAGIIGYVWWAGRSAGGSSTDAATPDASAAGDSGAIPVTDYGQGFDYGFLAGMNANGTPNSGDGSNSDGGTTPATAHNRITATVKNPAGHQERVYGYGSWVRTGGGWEWHPVLPSNINAFTKPYNQPVNGVPALPGRTPKGGRPLRHGSSAKLAQSAAASGMAYPTVGVSQGG